MIGWSKLFPERRPGIHSYLNKKELDKEDHQSFMEQIMNREPETFLDTVIGTIVMCTAIVILGWTTIDLKVGLLLSTPLVAIHTIFSLFSLSKRQTMVVSFSDRMSTGIGVFGKVFFWSLVVGLNSVGFSYTHDTNLPLANIVNTSLII